MNSCDACQIRKVRTNNDLRCIIQLLKSFATQKFKVHIPTYTYVDYIFMDEKIRVHNIKRIIKCTHPFPCQYFNTFKMQNFTPESFRPGVFHSFGTRTTDTQRGNSLHCTAENSIPIPNFQVRLKHILSATSAQFFRYL